MKYLFTILFLSLSLTTWANDLSLFNPILYKDNGQSYVILSVSWENAWHNNRNHDAAWVFFKFVNLGRSYIHAKLQASGHKVISVQSDQGLTLGFEIPKDRLGIFIYPQKPYRGKIKATIKLMLDSESFRRVNTRLAKFTAYGIEMVKIPEGAFSIGTPDTSRIKYGSMYQSDAQGQYKGLYAINQENQVINIGQQEGLLYYQSPGNYEGDQTGQIPAEYPKGVASFYIMKYEPTQGQYAEFLNSLSAGQTQTRANFGGKNYYQERGSITFENNTYLAKRPKAPCNFMSWDDAMAYADWACLRPMTEFEFTKAARGTMKPNELDYPWGYDSKENIQRLTAEDGNLIMLNDWDESKLSDETKAIFAASFYWVMDLSGSLWERVITIGHPVGRAFKGSHGDGALTGYGFANVYDWPKGVDSEGGFGYRGGGFYGYGRDYHDYNPYSSVADRPYGGWAGGNRSAAYGARFVRTSP